MKKLLTILLALLVVTGVVFADTSGEEAGTASLLITATQEGVLEHKISGDVLTTSNFESTEAKLTESIGLEMNSYDVAYYTVLTNKLENEITSITLTIPPLKHDTLLYYIPYVVSVVGNDSDTSIKHGFDAGVKESAPEDESLTLTKFLAALDAGTALRVESRKIQVALTDEYSSFVPAGSYSATIKFNIAAP